MRPASAPIVVWALARLCATQTTATDSAVTCDGCFLGTLTDVAPTPNQDGLYAPISTSVVVTAYAITSSTVTLGTCITDFGPQVPLSPHFTYSASYTTNTTSFQSAVASSFVAHVALPGCSVASEFISDPPLPKADHRAVFGSSFGFFAVVAVLPSSLLLWLSLKERRRIKDIDQHSMNEKVQSEDQKDERPYLQQKAELQAEQARHELGAEERAYQLRWQRAELVADERGYELGAEDRIYEMEAENRVQEMPAEKYPAPTQDSGVPELKSLLPSHQERQEDQETLYRIRRKPLANTHNHAK